MKILGVIPARSGSKRVANKNIKNLNYKQIPKTIKTTITNVKNAKRVILPKKRKA